MYVLSLTSYSFAGDGYVPQKIIFSENCSDRAGS